MKRIQSRALIAALAVTAASSAWLHAAPANAETKILFNRFVPAKHPFNTGMFVPWAKDVAKATNGRVKVEFSTASLAPPPKQWNMVSKGIADAAMLANIFERNRLKLPAIAQLPFSAESAEKRGVALWRTHKKFFEKANEYKGMKLIGLWAYPAYQFHSAKHDILQVSDLKGMKLHVVPGPTKEIAEILGATIVTGPTVKIFELISGKTVDGALIPNLAVMPFKYARYLNSVTNIPGGLGSNSMAAFMNKKVWDGLSQKHKGFVDQAASLSQSNMGKVLDKGDMRAGKELAKHKVKIHSASDEFTGQMKKLLQPLKDKWIKAANSRGVDGKAAFDYYVKAGQEAAAKMKK